LNVIIINLSQRKKVELQMKTTSFLVSLTGACMAAMALLLLPADPSSAADSSRSATDNDSKRPQFVFMGGEVSVPQRYVYTNGLTLGTAIKMARGLTAQAAPTKVTLTRVGEKPMTLDVKAIEQGKAKDIELQPGDKVHVPKK
jgi:SLBB domain